MSDQKNALDLSPETARLTEADSAARGTRKPASDEVDSARAQEARTEIVVDADPNDERIKNVDESVERAAW